MGVDDSAPECSVIPDWMLVMLNRILMSWDWTFVMVDWILAMFINTLMLRDWMLLILDWILMICGWIFRLSHRMCVALAWVVVMLDMIFMALGCDFEMGLDDIGYDVGGAGLDVCDLGLGLVSLDRTLMILDWMCGLGLVFGDLGWGPDEFGVAVGDPGLDSGGF